MSDAGICEEHGHVDLSNSGPFESIKFKDVTVLLYACPSDECNCVISVEEREQVGQSQSSNSIGIVVERGER